MRRAILNHVEVIVGVAVVVIAVAIAAVAIDLRHDDSARAARARTAQTAKELRAYGYGRDIRNWHEKLEGCGRSVADRRGSIKLLKLSAIANQAVANNGINSGTVRRARGNEAAAQRSAVHGLMHRVPPAFTCVSAYPKPVAPAGVHPLP